MSDKHLTNIELYNLCLEIHKQRLKKYLKTGFIIYQVFRAVYSSTWQAQILVFFNRLNFNNKNDN